MSIHGIDCVYRLHSDVHPSFFFRACFARIWKGKKEAKFTPPPVQSGMIHQTAPGGRANSFSL